MVTIPTIDQISGSTVMRKMRDLINHFITFAGEVDDELTTLDNKFDGYYTKIEVDANFPTFTYLSTNYYNKGETDSLVADITKYINALKPLYVWESSQTPGDWRISLLFTEKFKLLSNGTLDINNDGTTIKENSLTHQLYVDSQALAGNGLSGSVSPNVLDVKVDGTSIGFNEDGELESLVEGATYTAGDGISIDENNVISLEGWTEITEDKHAYFRAHYGTDKDFIVIVYNSYYYMAKGNKNLATPPSYGILPLIRESDSYSIQYPSKVSVLSLRTTDFQKYDFSINKSEGNFTSGIFDDVHCYDINGTTVINSTNIDTYISNTEILKPFIAQFDNVAQGFIFMPSVKSQLLFTIAPQISDSNEQINSITALRISNQNLINYIKNGGNLVLGGNFEICENIQNITTNSYKLYARDTI